MHDNTTQPSSPAQLPHPWKTVVSTVLGNFVLVVATVVLGSVATVVGWFPPRGVGMFIVGRWWSRIWMWSTGVKISSRGADALDPSRGYIFMANHQSMIDVPAMFLTLPGQTRFLAKKGLFKIPIFGWSLSSGGFIPVDRGNRAAARETFQAAIACLEAGRSILLFPEETRSPDGELLPFKSGGVRLALETGYPIVPVAILGSGRIRPKGRLILRPGSVEVRYGEPIDVTEYGMHHKNELTDDVRARITEMLAS